MAHRSLLAVQSSLARSLFSEFDETPVQQRSAASSLDVTNTSCVMHAGARSEPLHSNLGAHLGFAGFQTAAGKSVQVSVDSLKKAKNLLSENATITNTAGQGFVGF